VKALEDLRIHRDKFMASAEKAMEHVGDSEGKYGDEESKDIT